MKRLALSIIMAALGELGCSSTVTNTGNNREDVIVDAGPQDAQHDDDTTPSDAFVTTDADAQAIPDAPEDANETETDASAKDATADVADTSNPPLRPAVEVRFDGPTARSYYRGTRGAEFFRFTLVVYRTIDIDYHAYSIDQVRAGCAMGRDGLLNYQAPRLYNSSGVSLSISTTSGERGSSRIAGQLQYSPSIRLTPGTYSYSVAVDIRLDDPGCPFLNEPVQMFVGDVRTGTFFPADALHVIDEGRLARADEVLNNRILPGNVMTIIGPPYDQPVVSNDRGDFWFCGDVLSSVPGNPTNGYRGCCTNGSWRNLSDAGGRFHGGMLVRGEGERLYYTYGRSGDSIRRAFVPSTVELNSWYHTSGLSHRGMNVVDPSVCMNVVQATDAEIGGLELRGNVSLRPGSTYLRRPDDPAIYAIGGNRRIYAIRYRGRDGAELGGWMPPQLVRIIPEEYFRDYMESNAVIVDDAIPADQQLTYFDAPREQIETTLPR